VGLDIAVDHRRHLAVQIRKGQQNLISPLQHLRHPKRPAALPQQRRQIGAVNKLQHQKVALAIHAIIEHLRQGRIPQSARRRASRSKAGWLSA
jgi:hypothetical protein